MRPKNDFRAVVLIVLATTFSFLLTSPKAFAQINFVSKVWTADNGDGTYKNPILHADYSDPDTIRVGDDFYLTASSFNAAPGLPILHSKDLVNWQIINHVFQAQEPSEIFSKPQHGNGVWAPSIRFHNGEFYIYYGDPDFGIYMTKTRDPAGQWEQPVLIKAAIGWIDSCPFWDDNGNAYLVHAFAGSRAGIKSVLVINRMNAEGTKLLDDGVMIFDGHAAHSTVEGPKLYKRNGFYYIFAPAGGVSTGWQLVLRSKNVYGPYEEKIVLAHGKTEVNGPYQGALVDTQTNESWFLHFQDRGAYGRIVHLQPVVWKNDFPVIGVDTDGDGTGEPVARFRKPNVGKTYSLQTPADSDEFNENKLGLQWQWQANPNATWAFPFPQAGVLKMFPPPPLPDDFKNFWDVPNLLLQKFPAEELTVTTKVDLNSRFDTEKFGLIVMGLDYSYIAVTNKQGKLSVSQTTCLKADQHTLETQSEAIELQEKTFYLRVKVGKEAMCDFSFSRNGKNFEKIGNQFKAKEGKWIGAKVGLFFVREGKFNDAGAADVDWFRVE